MNVAIIGFFEVVRGPNEKGRPEGRPVSMRCDGFSPGGL